MAMNDAWISSDEILPVDGKPVLCVHSSGALFVGHAVTQGKPRWFTYGGEVGGTVTHWMELPEPPKAKKGKRDT